MIKHYRRSQDLSVQVEYGMTVKGLQKARRNKQYQRSIINNERMTAAHFEYRSRFGYGSMRKYRRVIGMIIQESER